MDKALPLNIPKNKNQFEAVPFVNDMTQYQLKVFIKRMWMNIQELSNLMDYRRKDVSQTLDNILDGLPIDKKKLQDRFVYGKYHEFVLRYDTFNRCFEVLNKNLEVIEGPIQGKTLAESKGTVKHRIKDSKEHPRPTVKVAEKPKGILNTIEQLLKKIK